MRIPSLISILLAAFTPLAESVQAEDRAPREVYVGILLFDGVQIIDFAAPYEVFGQAGYRISTVSADGKPVKTWMDLEVVPDLSFANARDFDVILVPGGHVHGAIGDKELQTWVRARSSEADIVLSVCTGSHILAASGLLQNLGATTFHNAFDGLAKMSPSTKVVRDARWVDNGKIITSAGLSSGIDAALHMVERLQGEDRARTVAMTLEYDWDPGQGFVRGTMADRYIPRIDVQWPEGSRFDRTTAYGDRNEWLERYRVDGKAAPSEYLELIKASYGSLPNWKVQEADAQRLLLSGTPEDGVKANWHIDVSPVAQDGHFEITSRLRVN